MLARFLHELASEGGPDADDAPGYLIGLGFGLAHEPTDVVGTHIAAMRDGQIRQRLSANTASGHESAGVNDAERRAGLLMPRNCRGSKAAPIHSRANTTQRERIAGPLQVPSGRTATRRLMLLMCGPDSLAIVPCQSVAPSHLARSFRIN